MGYEFYIAKRYLTSKHKTGFISIIGYISTAGVMIGVIALIIILSVMNGYESEVRAGIMKFQSHIRVRKYQDRGIENIKAILDQIRNIPHIAGLSPFIQEKGMITHNRYVSGLITKSIDPALPWLVNNLSQDITAGEFNIGTVDKKGRQVAGIVLGINLADKLNVKVGDIVTVIAASGVVGHIGQIPPNMPFVVTGFYKSGLYEFDDLYAFTSIEAGQKLYRTQMISGIEVKLDNMNKSDEVAATIEDRLGYPYTTLTWYQMNRTLFSWMKINKWTGFIILCLIILVAAFNIISNLIMVVLEKRRDIGILKAMGANSNGINRIFVYEGLLSGVVGTILGCLVGYLLCWSQLKYKWFSIPGEVYIINALPILMKWTDFVTISVFAITLCFLATLFPAARAAKLDPIEAIRYK